MPILDNKSKIERVYLPSTENLPEADKAFVDMETGPITTGDIMGVDPKAGEVEIGVRMLVARIKGWNFTDISGNELDVNYENVQKLAMADFTHLASKLPQDIDGIDAAQKKT